MGEEAQPRPAKKAAFLTRLLVLVGTGVLACIIGLGLYQYVVAGWLSEPEQSSQPAPLSSSVPVTFDRASTTVIMPPDNTAPASLLMYQVTFYCSNAETAGIVEANKAWFSNMLRELHSDHTRESLDDPALRESIQKQALLQANEILTAIQGGEAPANRILKVFHPEFFVYDQ